MAKRRFVFLSGNEELILPVTPQSIEIGKSIRIETVNIHGIGDLRIAGYRVLNDITISSFFPSMDYRFARADRTAYEYVAWFARMVDARRVVRFIVPDTDINIRVYIESIKHGEADGPNDVAYTLTLSEYESPSPGVGPSPRPEDPSEATNGTYTVQAGDTLCSIARRFLGAASRYMDIARANNIADPNILAIGQVLIIPRR